MARFALLPLAAFVAAAAAQDCNVDIPNRRDCGFVGSTQESCEADGCCWEPVSQTRDTPWCFQTADYVSVCDSITWTGATDAGFTQADYDIMYDLYKDNLNVEDCGAVVASRDPTTPGGSYYYHWMRDAGLSIKTWLEVNDNDLSLVKPEVDAYVAWVGVVQGKPDVNVDVRVEPKFEIPSGDPYEGGWCRPQTDGPALRAMALSKYGMMLNDNGEDTTDVWDRISFDMEWVVPNWDQNGCDLWEEVQSEDFYWNRMAYVYSLNIAADFADLLGKPDGDGWRALADEISVTAEAHYNGAYIYESTNREQDGSVIHATATFGEYLYPPESSEVADTIAQYALTFCEEYPINQDTVTAGLPGVLFGRYPGDTYDGGNPWQLLTAVLGETFYKGATANLKSIQARGVNRVLDPVADRSWMNLLHMTEGSTLGDLAQAQVEAGDAVMTRLYSYVNGDGMRIDEQINKVTGEQSSAQGLTWSYANVLHALKERANAAAIRKDVLGF